MAVLIGFLSALGAFVIPQVTLGNRILLFVFGVGVLILGLLFSNG